MEALIVVPVSGFFSEGVDVWILVFFGPWLRQDGFCPDKNNTYLEAENVFSVIIWLGNLLCENLIEKS